MGKINSIAAHIHVCLKNVCNNNSLFVCLLCTGPLTAVLFSLPSSVSPSIPLSLSISLLHIDSYREYFLWFLFFYFFVACISTELTFFSIRTAKVLKILRLWGTNFVWKREIRSVHVILSFLLSSRVHVYIYTLHIRYFMRFILVGNPHCLVAPYHCALTVFCNTIFNANWIENLAQNLCDAHKSAYCIRLLLFYLLLRFLCSSLRFAGGLEMWKFALFPSIYLFIWHHSNGYGRTFASLF